MPLPLLVGDRTPVLARPPPRDLRKDKGINTVIIHSQLNIFIRIPWEFLWIQEPVTVIWLRLNKNILDNMMMIKINYNNTISLLEKNAKEDNNL